MNVTGAATFLANVRGRHSRLLDSSDRPRMISNTNSFYVAPSSARMYCTSLEAFNRIGKEGGSARLGAETPHVVILDIGVHVSPVLHAGNQPEF